MSGYGIFRWSLFLFGVWLVVVGCNSGGGGSSSPTTADSFVRLDTNPASEGSGSVQSAEYTRQRGLAVVGAGFAYQRGWTGKNVVVGVLDGGLVWGHEEFVGAIKGYPVLVELVSRGGGGGYVRRWRLSEAQARGAYRISGAASTIALSVGNFAGTPSLMTPEQVRDDTYSEIGVFRSCGVQGGVFSCGGLGTTVPVLRHGVSVAGTVVARKNNVGIHGVAYDAKVLMGISGAQAQGVGPLDGLTSVSEFRHQRTAYLNRHVKVAVHSYGGHLNQVPTFPLVSAIYHHLVDILEQRSTDPGLRTIHVFAAGNGCPTGSAPTCDASRPEFPAVLPHYFSDLRRGQVIAVVAIDENRNLPSGYHRCGVAKDWCIGAPGLDIMAPSLVDGVYVQARGSSYAAPHVAGVLALMMEAFRGSLGSDELVARLFATANKTAPCNTPASHGQGCVDADAATRPVGNTRVASAQTTFSAQKTHFVAPSAFGDSLEVRVALEEIVAFDELNAPFFMPLAYAFESAPVERLRSFMSVRRRPREEFDWEGNRFFSMQGVDGGFFSGFAGGDFWGQTVMAYTRLVGEESFGSGVGFGMLGQELRLGVFSGTPSYLVDNFHEHVPAQGLVLSYGKPEVLEMNTGFLHEDERVFGGVGSGGFGEDLRTEHIFWGFAKKFDFGKSDIFVGGQMGMTWVLGSEESLLRFPSGILGSSFAAGVGRDDVLASGDRMALRVSQPLRVERGEAEFSFASGRRRDGSPVMRQFVADLAPSGREIAVELLYSAPVFSDATLRASLGYYMEPGHRKDAEDELALTFTLFTRF